MITNQRMKNVYYNCEVTNQGTTSIDCKYSASLLKPIIDNPLKYNINVNRFRLPLNGVPISRKNIPFQQWSVFLSYVNNAGQTTTADAFVPQVNQKVNQEPANYYILCYVQNATSIAYGTNTNNIMTINSTTFLNEQSSYNGTHFAYDNAYRYYALSIGSNNVYVYSQNGGQTETINLTASVAAITVNPFNSNLYTAYQDYDNGIYLQLYVNGTLSQQIQVQQAGTQVANVTLCYCNGYIFYGNTYDNSNTIYIARADLGVPVVEYNLGGGILVDQLCSPTGADSFWVTQFSNGMYIVKYNVNPSNGNITQSTTKKVSDSYGARVIGYDYSGNVLYSNFEDNTVKAYNQQRNSIVYSTSLFTSTNSFPEIAFPSSQIVNTPVESGDIDIYNYETYLTQINSAIENCFLSLNSLGGYEPTEAPRIAYNPETKLFYIVCQGFYLETVTVGGVVKPKYQIGLNKALYDKFLFPSTTSSDGTIYYSIVENDIVNATYLAGGTTPSYVLVYQEASSVFKFYDLVRILVVTSKIPVNGDVEGVNSSVNLITDIVPDTTTLTPDSIIIYQPTVLRNYNLESNVPLKEVDISFYYGTKDGSIYPVKLLPNEYASCKLQFEQVIE